MLGLDTKLERCARLAETRGRRLAIALVDTPEDADDVLQQALLVAARKANDIPLFSLWPWLARVIAFEAKNLRRAKARSRITAANGACGAARAVGDNSEGFVAHTTGASMSDPEHREPAAPPHEDPLAQAIAADLRGRLAAAMSDLAESERDALALVYGGGLSVREAARAAGVPRTTFQRSVDAGLESLRTKLGVSRRAAIGALGGWWGGLAGGWVPSPTEAGGVEPSSGGWVPSPTNAGGGPSRLPELVEGRGSSGCGHSCPPTSSIGAQSALSGATTAATSALVLGGLAMTMKQAMTLGVILVLAGAGLWWSVLDDKVSPLNAERRESRPIPNLTETAPRKIFEPPIDASAPVLTGPASSNGIEAFPIDLQPETLAAGGTTSFDGEFIEDYLLNKAPPINAIVVNDTPFEVKVSGRVLSTDGTPLPGAEVNGAPYLVQSEFRFNAEERHGYYLKEHWNWLITDGGQATTDEQGTFTLIIKGVGPGPGVTNTGPIARIIATLADWQMTQSPQLTWPDDKRDTIIETEIVMTKAGAIKGVAVDAITGAPVPMAIVGVAFKANSPTTYGSNPSAKNTNERTPVITRPSIVTADEDGTFELKGVGEGIWQMYGLPAGISPSKYRGIAGDVPGETNGAVTIEIRSGQVIDSIVVKVPRVATIKFRTNPDRIERLRMALLSLKRMKDSGSPNAYNWLGAHDSIAIAAQPDGVYVYRRLIRDHARVFLGAPEYAPVVVDIPAFTGDDVDLGTITLGRGASINLLVQDEGGMPLQGLWPWVGATDQHGGRSGSHVTFSNEKSPATGPDGRIVIPGLLAGHYHILVNAVGYASGSITVFVLENETKEATLTLAASIAIKGRIIPPPGAPAPIVQDRKPGGVFSNVQVHVLTANEVDSNQSMADRLKPGQPFPPNMYLPANSVSPVNVKADWTFEVPRVAPGRFYFMARVGSASMVVVAECKANDQYEVVIDLSAAGGVTGLIKGESGELLRSAKVMVFQPGQVLRYSEMTLPTPAATTTTNASGEYTFANLPIGPHEIRVEGFLHYHPNGEADRRVTVTVVKDTVSRLNIDFSAMRGVEMRARWTLGGTPAFAHLKINGLKGAKMEGVGNGYGVPIDDDGWFRVTGLGVGRYRLSGSGEIPGTRVTRSHHVEIEIPEGTTTHVYDAGLPPASMSGTISGHPATSQLAEAKLVFTPLDEAGKPQEYGWPTEVTVAGGAYRIDGLIGGTYRVKVSAPKHTEITRDIVLAENSIENFTFGEPGGSIILRNFRLVDGTGKQIPPPASAAHDLVETYLFDLAGKPVKSTRGGNLGYRGDTASLGGEVSLDAIPSGTYRVALSYATFMPWYQEVRVVNDESVKLDVTFVIAPKLIVRIPNDGMNNDQQKQVLLTIKWHGAKDLADPDALPATGYQFLDGYCTYTAFSREPDIGGLITTRTATIGRAGPVEITVTRPGFKDHVATLIMNAGDEVTHDIVWIPEDRLR